MERARLSITRKFMLWYWRHPPFSPYVTVSLSVDVQEALAYLRRLNEDGGPHLTMNHLVTAAIARAYAKYPYANASVSFSSHIRFDVDHPPWIPQTCVGFL